MANIMINGCNLFYEEHGTGSQTIIFLHDLFFNHRMFNQQMITLRDRYRCILIDLRAHGESMVNSGGCSMEAMAHDIWQLIEVRRYGQCHLIGSGMGGYLALMCALGRPHLTASLSVIGSSADESSEHDTRALKAIALRSKVFGLRMCQSAITKRTFSQRYLKDPDFKAQQSHWKSEFLKLDRRQIATAIAGFIDRPRLIESLYKIQNPTLIIGAEQDSVTPISAINTVNNSITGAKLVSLPATGHSANLERPREVNSALQGFLS